MIKLKSNVETSVAQVKEVAEDVGEDTSDDLGSLGNDEKVDDAAVEVLKFWDRLNERDG